MMMIMMMMMGTVTVSLGRLSQTLTGCESTDRHHTVVILLVLFIIVL